MTDRYYHGGFSSPAKDGGKSGMAWVRRGMGTRAPRLRFPNLLISDAISSR